MKDSFVHPSLNLVQKRPAVLTASSKKNFYLRSAITTFVLMQDNTPVSPFMNFDYNLAGTVNKDLIRVANNTMISRADEVWVFGEISDGVLMEIYIARRAGKPVRYFLPGTNDQAFREITEDDVRLEDVSPWMWDWVRAGKSLERWHPRLRFTKTYPLVYPAYSKRNFFLQMHISQFCLNRRVVPLNPFMLFRYFLGDSAPRDSVYASNNTIVQLCDEVWVFDEISNGVLAEIQLKRASGGVVRYFKTIKGYPIRFHQVASAVMVFENPALESFRHVLG